MTFRACLEHLHLNPILLASPAGLWTRDQILARAKELQQPCGGARIGLHLSDMALGLAHLVALDGQAEIILLLSDSMEPPALLRLAELGRLDCIITDRPVVAGDDLAPLLVGSMAEAAPRLPKNLHPQETSWVVCTSGTTGEPKLVGHTFASLTRTTKVDPLRGSSVRWGMLYDYTRFAGLQVLLQSTLSGSLLATPPADGTLEAKIKFFVEQRCTHLSGTPTLWRKILMTAGASDLELQQATLGGEIADDRILGAIGLTYPSARVVHIFASTEAGVGFSVADRRSGFPLSYATKPQHGFEIRIDGDRLFIRNTTVCPHYLGDENAFADAAGWVDTGDVVELEGDRVLFRGRASGVINIGGDKVHPEEVERALLAHPLVAAARVYAKPNPITGALVAADITLTDARLDPKEARECLRVHCLAALGRQKTPAYFKFVTELASSPTGKMKRS